jgi:hypothetical protein
MILLTKNRIFSSIQLFDRSICTHTIYSTIHLLLKMPWCGGGGGLPTYIAFIYSIDQKKVFGEPYLGVAAAEVPMCAR